MALTPTKGAIKVPNPVGTIQDDLLGLPGEKVVFQNLAGALTTDTAHDNVVKPVPATAISFTLNKFTVAIGQWKQLFVNYAPSYTGDKTIEWSVDDDTIVSVDKHGVVTALKEGDAVVTAKLKAQPTLSVTADIHAGDVVVPTITKKADVTGKFVGDTVPFASLFTATGSTAADYDFTATNGGTVTTAGVVTVTATGDTAVTAKLKADATIKATANITGVKAVPTIVKKADVTGKKGGETVAFADLFTATNSTAADYDFVVTPTAAATVAASTGLVTIAAATTGDFTVKATHKVKTTVTATASVTGVVAP